MRKYITIKDNFVKVEFVHFWSRKALTMLKHMEVFVERKTGLKRGTIATFDEYFLKNVASTSPTGDIHYSEEWEDTRGINASDLDLINNPPKTKKLAWVLDMICQDGIYTYGYLGFSIEPGFGFSFKQGLKNPKAIKQRTGPEKKEKEKDENNDEDSTDKEDNAPDMGEDDAGSDGGSVPSLSSILDNGLPGLSDGNKGGDTPVKPKRTRRPRTALSPSLPKDEIEKALDDLSKMIETNSLLIQ